MLQLHYFPGNASMAAHILLEELGVPYALRLVDRARGAHKAPEYLQMNPNGLIPVLTDDAEGAPPVLYETAAICLHLVDAHPAQGFAPPPGTADRARFYQWLAWLTNTLQAALIVYFYPERWAEDAAAAAQVKARAEQKIGAMLDIVDAQLASSSGPWLLGEHYSAVDPYTFMLCRWTRGFGRPARALAHIGPYLERVLARPAVLRALAQEGLAAPFV